MKGVLSRTRKVRSFSYLEWMIALRYIIPNRKQIFTSVVTILSFLGILIGVWALIVVMSVMNGFRTELLNRILGMNGHILIYAVNGFFDGYESLISRIEAIRGERFVVPILEGQVLVQGEIGDGTGALVRGLRQKDLQKLSTVSKNIRQGNLADFVDSSNAIAVGTGMARKLGLSVGSHVRLIHPDGDVTPFGVIPRIKVYKVVAIYEIGMYEYDSSIIFMPLKESQILFNHEDKIQSLEVFLDSPDEVDKVYSLLKKSIGNEFFMVDWRHRNQSFFAALQVERNVMFIILLLIVLVASLNIISSLVMLVKDKGRDIAILRTMGTRRIAIMRIFVMAGTMIGFTGTGVGVLLGVITSLKIEHIQEFISWLSGIDIFNRELYFLSQLPSRLDMKQLTLVIFVALFLSFVATLIPAWQASRLDPIKALRYE
ncbi:MAG: lipoprotein-releasing system permease protein [Candidatus Tokpelaia sp. JSC161]|jgi:lipoprotein-releasing system permease protein|nr:MAG: lipoprotein-releasing system permease protein [Candidatus Tokpelaia sp. JSC161]